MGFGKAIGKWSRWNAATGPALQGFLTGGTEGAEKGWRSGNKMFGGKKYDDENDALDEFKKYMAERNQEYDKKQTSTTAKSNLLEIINKMDLSSTEKAKLSQAVMSDNTLNTKTSA